MTKELLDEREFELINIIGKKLGSNQRDLSRQLDLSLGQTNMLIRRLVSKGYIRITQLDKRKVKYLLTPKGIAEKMRKSVKYTLNTINSFGLIRKKVKQIVLDLYRQGERNFYIYGESDLRVLIEIAFSEAGLNDIQKTILAEIPTDNLDGVLLIGKENVDTSQINHKNYIDLLAEVSEEMLAVGG